MRYKALYTVTAALFVAISTESFARLQKLAPPLLNEYQYNTDDPYLPYRPRPNTTHYETSPSGEFTFEYTHNSMGFRDYEHTIKKPPNTFRILAIGDSFTYGEGASYEATYPYQLEKQLNSEIGIPKQVEVINAGIYRFFPEAERLLLQHYAIKFQPDLIIVEFTHNDVMDTYLGIDAVKAGEDGRLLTSEARQIGKSGAWLYVHSHAIRILLAKYITWRFNHAYHINWSEVYEAGGFYEPAWQKVESEYSTIIEIARSHDSQILFFFLPSEVARDNFKIVARLSRWSKNQKVPFLDLTPQMTRAAALETIYWPKDGHCNSSGYRVISDTLSQKIVSGAFIQ